MGVEILAFGVKDWLGRNEISWRAVVSSNICRSKDGIKCTCTFCLYHVQSERFCSLSLVTIMKAFQDNWLHAVNQYV